MIMIPPPLIDNNRAILADWLKKILEEYPNTSLDIATGYFEISGYLILKEGFKDLKRFRLLLGKYPEISSDITFGDYLLGMIKNEIEEFGLLKDLHDDISDFIKFLKKEEVEVKIYNKSFLHGKAYIFDNVAVTGSSNFTASGLIHNKGELNTVNLYSTEIHEWFEDYWKNSEDFKSELISILEKSRFGSHEYSPYDVYIKALYEMQKEDLDYQWHNDNGSSQVSLTEFQEDGVKKVFSLLKRYKGSLVADSVGLGKTWIGKKIVEECYGTVRNRYLVICPAQLRSMWENALNEIGLPRYVLSHEELSSKNFIEHVKKIVGDVSDIRLIIVDESHNFRNPNSNGFENFFSLVNDYIAVNGEKPFIVFLTATPINNSIWDLYWQIMLIVGYDRNIFIKENIPDLYTYFKNSEEDPSKLNDLLNAISIRRTRDYIKRNYPDAEINGKKIIWPERILENISYKLDDVYKGMYKEISEIISEKLKMPYFRMLKYKKKEKDKPAQAEIFELNRMMALEGIIRTLYLKRLESSVESFRISINQQIGFLEKFKSYLLKGQFLSKDTFNRFVNRLEMMNEDQMDTNFEELEKELEERLIEFKIENYRESELFGDIENDINLLKEIMVIVNKIDPEEDSKLKKLKDMIKQLYPNGQIVMFTYYVDTLNYIYENIISSKDFYELRIGKMSGKESKIYEKGEERKLSREELKKEFINKNIDLLMSTDVLSEGENLQSALYLINYDLHWNPTRMIQRAGRIDRIGSPYTNIYIYNFFPENELEELLNLVRILQNKIIDIDNTVGLDQTILGEKINPKVFGIMRKIKDKDTNVMTELETDMFGGGEKFYEPLKHYIDNKGRENIDKIPYGIHSGLQNGKIRGIFFCYKYGNDIHYWYLYDVSKGKILENITKTEILDFISCKSGESRIIPNFFDEIFRINKEIMVIIDRTYNGILHMERQESLTTEWSKDISTKFMNDMIFHIEDKIDNTILDFEDRNIEEEWESIKNRLRETPLTKRRLKMLRTMWKEYKVSAHHNWKELIGHLGTFLQDKGILQKEKLAPFDRKNLKLVVIDFVS